MAVEGTYLLLAPTRGGEVVGNHVFWGGMQSGIQPARCEKDRCCTRSVAKQRGFLRYRRPCGRHFTENGVPFNSGCASTRTCQRCQAFVDRGVTRDGIGRLGAANAALVPKGRPWARSVERAPIVLPAGAALR
jgi:hypothetical protein